ncbi:MAG: excinuclease ABC subunit UvrA [Chloroflexi bacterium]|nr:excinuclease ABC subunit UvrA [Chloroflexota bacterium]
MARKVGTPAEATGNGTSKAAPKAKSGAKLLEETKELAFDGRLSLDEDGEFSPHAAYIEIRGARQHNLKSIDLKIPRDQLVVITGISGSGKSSLAFDTLYAEGQRRYIESLSAYARQFLGQLDKPDVDFISGLSPAISIDQKGVSHNPRSTVGTVTEIYDYLRLLYARIGRPHCPNCGRPITQQTVQQIVDNLLAMGPGERIMLLAPVVEGRKGEHLGVLDEIRSKGFVRVRIDREVRDLSEAIELGRYQNHTIEVVVDRVVLPAPSDSEDSHADISRLTDSVETALRLAEGEIVVLAGDGEETRYSERFACSACGLSFAELAPRNFSFNSPHGACRACTGLGFRQEVDAEAVIPNRNLSLREGAIKPWFRGTAGEPYYLALLEGAATHYGFSLDVPVKDLDATAVDLVLHGSGKERISVRTPHYGRAHHGHRDRDYQMVFEGVIPSLERRHRDTESEGMREDIERYMWNRPCPECDGLRLRPETLAVTIAGRPISELTSLTVGDAAELFDALGENRPSAVRGHGRVPHAEAWEPERSWTLSERDQMIARQVLKEIRARLGFLVDVGLDYLTLDRAAMTLSGGEGQRIRLATQIGSGLVGVLYILDEPSVGLHQRDNGRLLDTLKRLRNLGNSVLVVEHDEDTIRQADFVVDIGPGAGELGGEVVATGSVADLIAAPRSLTGKFLSGEMMVPVPAVRRPGNGKVVRVLGAAQNNLKEVDVEIPLGKFVCITGVSGSGKSTLVNDIIYKAFAQALYRSKDRPGLHDRIEGTEHLDKVVDIDQAPIGRTPRSNPATYTGAFTPIRELFAAVPESRVRGYLPGRFSFNVKGGRCEACQGEGIIQIEMNFLPDVYVPCETCKGKRYNREALEIRYRGVNIAEVLEMTVAEGCEVFGNVPTVRNKLTTLNDVGLGYVRLGQAATTLSGGEAQRVKLATELSKRATGKTLYILDEPTVGLHFADVSKLLDVLNRLVEGGNTVLVIEHNLDVIKTADWIIDLGPEGGRRGGELLAVGTPEDVAACPESYTGRYLRDVLARGRVAVGAGKRPKA